jgi:hypothetical protein
MQLWSEHRQIEHALRVAATARAVLADDPGAPFVIVPLTRS